MTSVRWPSACARAARCAQIVVLPAPPLREATVMMFMAALLVARDGSLGRKWLMKGYGTQPSSWQCAQKAPPSRGAREGKVSGCIILDRGSRLDPNGDDLELHGRHALDYNPEQALGSSLDEQTLPRLLEAQHELVD